MSGSDTSPRSVSERLGFFKHENRHDGDSFAGVTSETWGVGQTKRFPQDKDPRKVWCRAGQGREESGFMHMRVVACSSTEYPERSLGTRYGSGLLVQVVLALKLAGACVLEMPVQLELLLDEVSYGGTLYGDARVKMFSPLCVMSIWCVEAKSSWGAIRRNPQGGVRLAPSRPGEVSASSRTRNMYRDFANNR